MDLFFKKDEVPRRCKSYGLKTKLDIINRIISMVLTNKNLFGSTDLLDEPIFNSQWFFDQLMPEEKEEFEQFLREGVPKYAPNIIEYVGPVLFFKKFSMFIQNPKNFKNYQLSDGDDKFRFFLDKYLNNFNSTHLCQIVEILKNGFSKCETDKEHTIILVDRNSARVDILKQKKKLGAPITAADVELLEDEKIMELKLESDKDIYSQESIDKGIYNKPLIKNIYDKALDNKQFLMAIFPNYRNISIDNIDPVDLATLKRIFKTDFNTTEQLVSLVRNIIAYLYEIDASSIPPASFASSSGFVPLDSFASSSSGFVPPASVPFVFASLVPPAPDSVGPSSPSMLSRALMSLKETGKKLAAKTAERFSSKPEPVGLTRDEIIGIVNSESQFQPSGLLKQSAVFGRIKSKRKGKKVHRKKVKKLHRTKREKKSKKKSKQSYP